VVEGFELTESEGIKMDEIWPAGTDNARRMLDRFLHAKSRKAQLGLVSPLNAGEELDDKSSRIMLYKDQRDKGDRDSTSRLRY
jgi:deoxyribodipyrimidine photo-lyase